MEDRNFCMSSFLALRYISENNVNFSNKLNYNHPKLPMDEARILVGTADDVDDAIYKQVQMIKSKYGKIGIMLSGGMDSAILATYLSGCDAYTFRFLGGKFNEEELKRAEYFAKQCGLILHYVDIDWKTVENNLKRLMLHKGGPIHSIEPQIYQAALQAKENGIDLMVIGDGSDYVFGGMDQLLSKDWAFEEFYHRYIYVEPEEVLKNPRSVKNLFERYRCGDGIDFLNFINTVATEESYGSYSNAFNTAELAYFDPYENLKMANTLDLDRIRNGESKYLIRELFKKRYPNTSVPEKLPMPRPVDIYFANWNGPLRDEFKKDIDMNRYSGNQRWLIWCLEQFLNLLDEI